MGRFGTRGSWSLWVEAEDSRPAILVLGIFFTIDNFRKGRARDGLGVGGILFRFEKHLSGLRSRAAVVEPSFRVSGGWDL